MKNVVFFLRDILKENQNLYIFFIAKYPSLLAKIQKKLKKVEELPLIEALLDIFVAGYPLLTALEYNNVWVAQSIISIVGSQAKTR